MSTHPITNGGGQYSYPVVPANPAALASAAAAAAAAAATSAAAAQQRPQQRSTGPIIAGATTSTTGTAAASTPRSAATSTAATTSTPRSAATSTPNANATAISNSNGGSINKFHPAGRYANASLSILGAYAAPSSERGDCSKRQRIEDCANVLERLVHPLFLCANNSSNGDDREDGTGTKERRGDGDRGSGENGDSDEGKDDVSSSKIDYRVQLRVELERCKRQNLLLVKRRENVFKSLVTLHELYETGLDGIARMNDLRFVPDNVMPDKIPK